MRKVSDRFELVYCRNLNPMAQVSRYPLRGHAIVQYQARMMHVTLAFDTPVMNP